MSLDDMAQVNWPESRVQTKFVQVVVGDRSFLYFGDASLPTHTDILRKFLTESGLEFEVVAKSSGKMITSPKGDNYEAVGMGYATVEPNGHYAYFRGNSFDYKMPTNREQLQKTAKANPDWEFHLEEERIQ